MERFAIFDFDFSVILVRYESEEDLGTALEANTEEWLVDNRDSDYDCEECVEEVMTKASVPWKILERSLIRF